MYLKLQIDHRGDACTMSNMANALKTLLDQLAASRIDMMGPVTDSTGTVVGSYHYFEQQQLFSRNPASTNQDDAIATGRQRK